MPTFPPVAAKASRVKSPVYDRTRSAPNGVPFAATLGRDFRSEACVDQNDGTRVSNHLATHPCES
jgi:hypothetical protein